MKHIIRYIFAVLSFVAFMPVAIAQDDVSQVHATKTATSNGDGSYTLTLESFVEGEAHEEVVETQPADIILVMDMSASMASAATYYDPVYTILDHMGRSPYGPIEQDWSYQSAGGAALGRPQPYYYLHTDGELYEVSVILENGNYSLRVTIGSSTKYLSQSNGVYGLYDEAAPVVDAQATIWSGTLYQGVSYRSFLDGDGAKPGLICYLHSDGNYYDVLARSEDVEGNTIYPLYVEIGGETKYLDKFGLSDVPSPMASEQRGQQYFGPLYLKDMPVKTTKVEGLVAAVQGFVNKLGEKSEATGLHHRLAMITFNKRQWYNVQSQNMSLHYPRLIEHTPGREEMTVVLKDFTDLSSSTNRVAINQALLTMQGVGMSHYEAGLCLADALFRREAQTATPYIDFDNNGTVDSYEIPSQGIDHANYSERQKIVIIIGDAEIDGDILEEAEDWAETLKDEATVFFVYVNRTNEHFSKAQEMASSSENAIPVDNYDETLVTKLVDITQEIGGAGYILNENSTVQDVVVSDFKVSSGASSISVKVAPLTAVSPQLTFGTAVDPEVYGLDIDVETETNDQGETIIQVTGFDFSEHWCGSDHGNPHAGGLKLILEVQIEPDVEEGEDLIGGHMLTNNSDLSGILDAMGQFVKNFEVDPVYLGDLHLRIKKQVMEGTDNAVITVQAVDEDGNAVTGQNPIKLILNAENPIAELRYLNEDYYYEITEDGWAWDYSEPQPQKWSTKTRHKNPFVFTSAKQNSEVKHDEKVQHIEEE